MISLKLEVKDKEAENFYNAILPDFEKKGRSDIKMVLEKDLLLFEVKSRDFTSVRAAINNILLKLRTLKELKE